MNKATRNQISKIIETLDSVKSDLENFNEEDQEKYGNMPESLQESERGEAMREAVENLESAVSSCFSLSEAKTFIKKKGNRKWHYVIEHNNIITHECKQHCFAARNITIEKSNLQTKEQ